MLIIDRYAPAEKVETNWSRLAEIDVGESFTVKQSETGYKSASTRICIWANKLGRRFSIKTTAEGKVVTRVW